MELKDRGETFQGRPLYLPDQMAVLIGVVNGLPDQNEEKSAYYIHWRGGIHIGDYHEADDMLVLDLIPDEESSVMSDQTATLIEDIGEDATVTLSSIGEAVYDAHRLEETGAIGVKQAHVYALKHEKMHNFGRQETATILNISANTVDRHLQEAEKNVQKIEDFIATHQSITEKVSASSHD